ncbi:MAG: phosphoglycerate kinase [candidate division NC10 bacterium]|nr:phosphoglycerate kinase [candidate division NC10 bacterium]
MEKIGIDELDLSGKRVLIRVDFNVPLNEALSVTDDTRIRASLPTISYAMGHGAKVILLSHLGRPKGKVVPEMSLRPVAQRLSQLLGKEVKMAKDCVGEEVKSEIEGMRGGEVLLLENCRFHKGDEENDEAFSRALAELADIYVNDAFGAAHRAHASTVGVTRFVPVSAAGFLLQREIQYLGKAVSNPERPFIAILGGAKVSDKIGVIRNLMGKVDALLIGGAMAYTFEKAQGLSVGSSLVEEDKLNLAKQLLQEAQSRKLKLLLPLDHVVAERAEPGAKTRTVKTGAIPDGWKGLDIGPQTIEGYSQEIQAAKTILWNGPLGVFEIEPFRQGTMAIARAIASSSATSIVGGGDSAAAVAQAKVADRITHISTGGGATLEFLEGIELPGIAALTDRR